MDLPDSVRVERKERVVRRRRGGMPYALEPLEEAMVCAWLSDGFRTIKVAKVFGIHESTARSIGKRGAR